MEYYDILSHERDECSLSIMYWWPVAALEQLPRLPIWRQPVRDTPTWSSGNTRYIASPDQPGQLRLDYVAATSHAATDKLNYWFLLSRPVIMMKLVFRKRNTASECLHSGERSAADVGLYDIAPSSSPDTHFTGYNSVQKRNMVLRLISSWGLSSRCVFLVDN